MKKVFKKSNIFSFLLGALVFGSIGVVSAYTIFANDIGYTPKDSTWKKSNGEDITNVKDAIDELYNKANSNKNTICLYISGTKNSIGAKYVCHLDDGIVRNFYILAIDNNKVKMIIDRNLTDEVGSDKTMTWSDANVFFNEGHEGYSLKQIWLTKVQSVDLPSAQDIANAGNIAGWDVTTATSDNWSYFGVNSTSDTSKRSNYAWLYNYTNGCLANGCSSDSNYSYGYWTKDKLANNSSYAWSVTRAGRINYDDPITGNNINGVRPVITVLKSQLN